MKSPTTTDLEELKRNGRYLRGRPVGAILFGPHSLPGVLEVFCVADTLETWERENPDLEWQSCEERI